MIMTDQHHVLDEVRQRLNVRGDTFLDSDGEALYAALKAIARQDQDAAQAIQEIDHRRSEQIE
jgi:dephospho-CoA kinase